MCPCFTKNALIPINHQTALTVLQPSLPCPCFTKNVLAPTTPLSSTYIISLPLLSKCGAPSFTQRMLSDLVLIKPPYSWFQKRYFRSLPTKSPLHLARASAQVPPAPPTHYLQRQHDPGPSRDRCFRACAHQSHYPCVCGWCTWLPRVTHG